MHISRVQIANYRNFKRANVVLNKGINTIIGENSSGKTNLFRAIRLLLDDSLLRFAYKLDEDDFHRGLGDWRGHWIIISIEFDEVSPDEAIQALFLHGAGNIECGAIGKATYNLLFRPNASIRAKLAALEDGDRAGLNAIIDSITIESYETVFTGKSDADFTDPTVYAEIVGDFENVIFSEELHPPLLGVRIPNVLSVSKEVSFTFIQALRDVVSEFHNNRTNPLLTLLKSKSGEIDAAEFARISTMVGDLNREIESLPDVQGIREDISGTIKGAAGETYSPTTLAIHSDLPSEADRLFQSLKLFVGESGDSHEGAIHELSLGGANLIFLTLKLLEFKYQKVKQSFANFLLIEEPEAHIHTHIQKTLFDKLDFTDTQIIYSTHSTHVSEVSNVKNVNVLARVEDECRVFQPTTDLGEEDVQNIQRYLDAVRSNLLFAKSVVLVEGDAEEILIPILVKKVLGVSLDELGISLINIRSTGFQNLAVLFHNNRIQKRCAIVTDMDAAFIDTTANPLDSPADANAKLAALNSQNAGACRRTALNGFCANNPWVKAYFAPHTFEVDFVRAGNTSKAVAVVDKVYAGERTRADARADLESGDIARLGRRILTMANNCGKGWFAILVGRVIDHKTVIPDYILDAIIFAHGPISRKVMSNILLYRLKHNVADGQYRADVTDEFRVRLAEYADGTLDFAGIREAKRTAFPQDQINAILQRV